MEINGVQQIPASRDDVWRALNDPAVLKQCLPGCESVEREDDETFRIVITAAIGPLRPRFQGVLRLKDAVPPESCVMHFEGQGGALGFGKGSATVRLVEADGGTELKYAAQVQVGGKLAQVGSRLIDTVARKMSDDFFKAFRKQIVGEETPATNGAAPERAAVSSTSSPVPAAASTDARPEPAPADAPPATPAAAVAPAASAASAAAMAPRAPVSAASFPDRTGPVQVPGWWLFVAFAFGAAAALSGIALLG